MDIIGLSQNVKSRCRLSNQAPSASMSGKSKFDTDDCQHFGHPDCNSTVLGVNKDDTHSAGPGTRDGAADGRHIL
jgi:hypothetical protein